MATPKIVVKFRKAETLPLAPLRPTPNPYVILTIDGKQAFRTQTIAHSASPVWNEFCNVDLPTLNSVVELNIWDDIKMLPDTSFGKVIITPEQLNQARNKEVNLNLKIAENSTLTISIFVIATTALVSEKIQFKPSENKRKGLLIGINYRTLKEGEGRLSGCINDVKNIRNLLTSRYGYQDSDFKELNDDASTPANLQPTRQNILAALAWLVQGAKKGDHLVFHFSGHGGQVKDLSGDEKDGKDECIFPADFQKAGSIIDDEIYKTLVQGIPAGCHLFAIMDCCHSGTGMDLPFEYKELGTAAPAPSANSKVTFNNFSARHKKVEDHSDRGDVILISGCKDEETSTDAVMAGKASGAMTYALIRALQSKPDCTYGEMLKQMRVILKQGQFSQAPQLSASVPFDFQNTKVIL